MFLTDLDSRAAIKGSRDPLGLVPLWSQFGRHVVGNLTTVTGSVRGFTTTLLGYHFAREVQERDGNKSEATLALFLKFEQLAAYCRYQVKRDDGFRGIERVKRNLAEGGALKLSARGEDQILSNQKVYGLWGLYSVASRASGLLERDEAILTRRAREFVESQYIGFLSKEGFKDGRDVVELLRQERADLQIAGKHAGLARAIAQIHGLKLTRAEREFYREHLVLGGPGDSTKGRQGQLAELMTKLPAGSPFDRKELKELIRQAGRRGEGWAPLADRLERVDLLESVLVPAESAFAFVLARHGQKTAEVAREIEKAWGPLRFIDGKAFGAIQGEVADAFHAPEAGGRWLKIVEALAAGDYRALLRLLIEHNGSVMQTRNGSAPWIRVADGKLDVRFRDEVSELPDRRELPGLWRNNYFLNPLKDVIGELAEA